MGQHLLDFAMDLPVFSQSSLHVLCSVSHSHGIYVCPTLSSLQYSCSGQLAAIKAYHKHHWNIPFKNDPNQLSKAALKAYHKHHCSIPFKNDPNQLSRAALKVYHKYHMNIPFKNDLNQLSRAALKAYHKYHWSIPFKNDPNQLSKPH